MFDFKSEEMDRQVSNMESCPVSRNGVEAALTWSVAVWLAG